MIEICNLHNFFWLKTPIIVGQKPSLKEIIDPKTTAVLRQNIFGNQIFELFSAAQSKQKSTRWYEKLCNLYPYINFAKVGKDGQSCWKYSCKLAFTRILDLVERKYLWRAPRPSKNREKQNLLCHSSKYLPKFWLHHMLWLVACCDQDQNIKAQPVGFWSQLLVSLPTFVKKFAWYEWFWLLGKPFDWGLHVINKSDHFSSVFVWTLVINHSSTHTKTSPFASYHSVASFDKMLAYSQWPFGSIISGFITVPSDNVSSFLATALVTDHFLTVYVSGASLSRALFFKV